MNDAKIHAYAKALKKVKAARSALRGAAAILDEHYEEVGIDPVIEDIEKIELRLERIARYWLELANRPAVAT